jgi:hypothetical protein
MLCWSGAGGGKWALLHNKPMHPTRLSAALKLNVLGGRVIGGVMVPLPALAKLQAAFAPLSVAELERYPDGVDGAVCTRWPFVLRRWARAAASRRSTITTACTRPRISAALNLNQSARRVMPSVRRLRLCVKTILKVKLNGKRKSYN